MSADDAPKRREKATDLVGGRKPEIGADRDQPPAAPEVVTPEPGKSQSAGREATDAPKKRTQRRRSAPKKPAAPTADDPGEQTEKPPKAEPKPRRSRSAAKSQTDRTKTDRTKTDRTKTDRTRSDAAPSDKAPSDRPAAKPRGRQKGRGPRKRSQVPPAANDRVMLVHNDPHGIQVAVLEEGDIVEHYVTRPEDRSIVGNVYLGKVQNVLPGMEASFIDFGEGRNGVLYAGEV